MNITYPYNNDIVVIEDFVTDEELALCMGYFLRFDNEYQDKDSSMNQVDTADFFSVFVADSPFSESGSVMTIFMELQKRIEDTSQKLFNLSDVQYTQLNGFSRLRGVGVLPHADDLNPNIDNHVYYGCIVYWNDDYDGGELTYPELSLSHKPKAGSLLIHPGSIEYTHGVDKVTRGQRFSSPMFILGIDNTKP